ncbi:hypothetical protein HRW13_20430 [Streptomyces lunaelactis]|nr:hypothetical protein [Streptomyces lunaelactis]
MATVSEEQEALKVDELPVDAEGIGDSTDAALVLALATTTREEIDAKTPVLIGHLQLLLGEELGADEDPTVRELFHKAYAVLDLKNRPTPDTPAFSAFIFMREVASLTRRLLWVYTQRSGTGVA